MKTEESPRNVNVATELSKQMQQKAGFVLNDLQRKRLQTEWTIGPTAQRRYDDLREYLVCHREPRARDSIIHAESQGRRQIEFILKRITLAAESSNFLAAAASSSRMFSVAYSRDTSHVLQNDPYSADEQAVVDRNDDTLLAHSRASTTVAHAGVDGMMTVTQRRGDGLESHSQCLPLDCSVVRCGSQSDQLQSRPQSSSQLRRVRAIERFNRKTNLSGHAPIPLFPALIHEENYLPHYHAANPSIEVFETPSSAFMNASASAAHFQSAAEGFSVQQDASATSSVVSRDATFLANNSILSRPGTANVIRRPQTALAEREVFARHRRAKHEEAVVAAYLHAEASSLLREYQHLWRAELLRREYSLFGEGPQPSEEVEFECVQSSIQNQTRVYRRRVETLAPTDAAHCLLNVQHAVLCIRSNEAKERHRKEASGVGSRLPSLPKEGLQSRTTASRSLVYPPSLLSLPLWNTVNSLRLDCGPKKLKSTLMLSTQCPHLKGDANRNGRFSLQQIAAAERLVHFVVRVQSIWRAKRASKAFEKMRRSAMLIQRVGAGYLERYLHMAVRLSIRARLTEEEILKEWMEDKDTVHPV